METLYQEIFFLYMSFPDRSYQVEEADTCPKALTVTLAGEREHVS